MIIELIFTFGLFVLLNLFLFYSKLMSLYWSIFSNGVLIALTIMYLVRKYTNLTNFIFSGLTLGSLLAIMIYYKFDFKKYEEMYQSSSFLFWFMFVLSAITIYGLVNSFNYYLKIRNMDPIKGDKGETGEEGKSGETLDSDLNMCYNQASEIVEQEIRKYKKEHNIEFDEKLLQFHNLYMKRQLKRICSSKHYDNLKKQFKTHYGPVQITNSHIKKIVKHILKYKKGLRFLEDPFFTNFHWNNELLGRNETVSPFVEIEQNEAWNWN